ncbi:MAG: methyltransferase domain-containing protein [Methylophilaceae bacterium]|jgi:SAM-dependent methyltransferase|nr:methyltransferase domain-containing protein [Methylophilaceae bacterium]|tara:strand:- start:5590 stop:6324 length:735 start_codon:yes stop_codon:yes gene_type:complete
MQTYTQEAWFESTLGQSLLDYEQPIYDHAVSDLFGFYAVQIGLPQVDCLKNSRIPHIIIAGNATGHIRCESDYLPFAESSIDLLCMPHALEFSANPHQTLREAARVLVPEGYLIMTGFNPFSFWGLKRLLRKKKGYPWGGQFFSLLRIKDWLALLGLEFVQAEFFCHELPINNETWLKRFSIISKIGAKWWPMMGGQYVIVAKKRVVNITLLKPKWKQRLLQPGLAVSGQKNKHQTSQNKVKCK